VARRCCSTASATGTSSGTIPWSCTTVRIAVRAGVETRTTAQNATSRRSHRANHYSDVLSHHTTGTFDACHFQACVARCWCGTCTLLDGVAGRRLAPLRRCCECAEGPRWSRHARAQLATRAESFVNKLRS
jgi:hypothetical protein